MRGTTPVFEFELPIDAESLVALYITITQARKTIVERSKAECEISGSVVRTRLTQEETLQMKANSFVEIQLRCRNALGEAFASEIWNVETERILKDGVI